MREPPAEVQERAATALIEPARAVGLKLAKRGDRELDYKPRVAYPMNFTLLHIGEQMAVKFDPDAEGRHPRHDQRCGREIQAREGCGPGVLV